MFIFSGNFHDVPVCWIYCSHNVYIYFCVIGPMPIIDWKVCLFIFVIFLFTFIISCLCTFLRSSREPLTNSGDPESGSVTSFGTLRRAHIDRNKVSRTSFYLRVGALGKKTKCWFAIYFFREWKIRSMIEQ